MTTVQDLELEATTISHHGLLYVLTQCIACTYKHSTCIKEGGTDI